MSVVGLAETGFKANSRVYLGQTKVSTTQSISRTAFVVVGCKTASVGWIMKELK